MTKQAYLDELKWYLNKSLDIALQADIVADYAEYFDTGIAAGDSEDKLCAALGAPQKVAAELINEQSEYLQDTHKFIHTLVAWIIFAALQIILLSATLWPFPHGVWAYFIKPAYALLCPVTAIYLSKIDIMIKYSSLRTKALQEVAIVGKAAFALLVLALLAVIGSYLAICTIMRPAMPISADATAYGKIIAAVLSLAQCITAAAFMFLIIYSKKLNIYFTCAYFVCVGMACTIADITYMLADFTAFDNMLLHLLLSVVPLAIAVAAAALWQRVLGRKLAKAVSLR